MRGFFLLIGWLLIAAPVAATPGGASTSGASTSGASTSGASTSGASTSGASTSGASTSGASTSGASTSGVTVLVLGDSISAAYGIDKADGWVALFEQQYQPQCPGFKVINASVSGEISAGGRARLPALLAQHQPQIVVIELGGNDGLRGLSPQSLEQNLRTMVTLSREAGATPLLLGMYLPPNYGVAYRQLFEATFTRVADSEQVPLVPFFLDQVGGVDALMQSDGLHPTAEAQPQLLDNALIVLEPALQERCL